MKTIGFWPMDFTFVCPTEIAEFGRKNAEFAKRDAQLQVPAPTHATSTWRGATTTLI